jgi:pre-mRNA-splicing factor SYF2
MATSNKRKTATSDDLEEGSTKRRFVESEAAEVLPDLPEEAPTSNEETQEEGLNADEETTSTPAPANSAAAKAAERQARFKALQARQNASRKQNLKETQLESHRMSTDPNLLNALNRKHAIASHKLLKADTEAEGGDFERKRAWDWTVDESEKWDKRMNKKEKHRDDVAFKDYTQEARKVYKRQMRDFKPDVAAYKKAKWEAMERAAGKGQLELQETETGDLIAFDTDGNIWSMAEEDAPRDNKPDKEAVDRLVADLKKAEENRLKKRRERNKANEDDGGDVTYINVKVSMTTSPLSLIVQVDVL